MKRTLSVVLSTLLVMLTVSIGVTANAADEKLFDINVSTDKTAYAVTDIVGITIEVTNISNRSVGGVAISAKSDDYLLASNNLSAKEFGDLNPGESASIKFNVVVNRKIDGIKFFDKISLFFKQLFKKYNALTTYIPEHKDNESTKVNINHSYLQLSLEAKVWYSVFTVQELAKMKEVDTTLSESENVSDGLESLLNRGLIKNIVNGNGIKWFSYSNGTLGGVMTDNFSDTAEDKTQTEGIINHIPESQINIYEEYAVGRALILYSFNYPSDLADQNFRRPFYDSKDSTSLVNKWGMSQVMTDVDDEVTVYDIKNIDKKYDIVCFSGHGSTIGTSPVMCLTEKVTDKNKQEYADDIINKRIVTVTYDGGTYYWVFPSIFENYESNGLEDKMMFFQCCEAFGEGNTTDYQFADNVMKAGADVAVGFHNSVNSQYGRNFMSSFISAYINGETAENAFDIAKLSVGSNDSKSKNVGEPVAEPLIKNTKNAKFLNGMFSVLKISVIDNTGKTVDVVKIKVNQGKMITSSFISNGVKKLYGYMTAVMQSVQIVAEKETEYSVSAYLI